MTKSDSRTSFINKVDSFIRQKAVTERANIVLINKTISRA